jgi:hypothetical protein
MTKPIENKTMFVVLAKHWRQIQPQVEEWLESNQIVVKALSIPPDYESVAIRFPSESDLVAFKMRWGAKLKIHD